MSLKDKTAVVGIGATKYYRRGESLPLTETELACQSILTVMLNFGSAFLTLPSVTAIWLFDHVPAVVGVPEICPVP